VAPVSREELFWPGTDELQEGIPDGSRPVTELTEWLARPHASLGKQPPGSRLNLHRGSSTCVASVLACHHRDTTGSAIRSLLIPKARFSNDVLSS